MRKNYFIVGLMAVAIGSFLGCNDENASFTDQNSQVISSVETNGTKFERLTFKSSQDLLSAIRAGEENGIEEVLKTRSTSFRSLLSPSNSSTRASSSETFYEVLGYDTLVPNKAFAALLNPLGEVQSNDTIYKINHNGTYFFIKKKEANFDQIYKTDSLGILISDNLYKLADGVYRYKTFPDEVAAEEIDSPDNDSDDSWGVDGNSTRASIAEPNYDSFPIFNADRHTWFGKRWQSIFGNDKYYDVKLSSKRKVRGRLYAYHYVVYSESGVTGMMEKKNWIGWSKTKADELRIGWNNIVLGTSIDDPSLKGIPQQTVPIVGGIYQTEIPSIGKGNLVDLYIADVEKEDIIRIVGEGVKLAIKKANSAIGSGRNVTVQAACLATRTKLYLVIMKDIRKEYDTKSMTHVFSSDFNIIVTLNPSNLPSNALGWARAVSKTLSQKSFELKGGEAIICGRLNNQWKGMKIVKKMD